MKQQPNNLKYKKFHKVNFFYSKAIEKKRFFTIKGIYGIQSLEYGKITLKQIEACRKSLRRGFTKKAKIWINLFTNIPITKKPLGARMGKGKGNISHWVAIVKKGQILFEVNSDLSIEKSQIALNRSKGKLSVKTQISKIIY